MYRITSFASTMLAVLALAGPALAGPFETASANMGAKYGVPDFTFTKAEFGNTALGQNIHLGLEMVVEHFNGATVVYNPATDAVDVYVNAGSGFNGRIIYATDRCELLPKGSGKLVLGVAGADGICLPADTLAGKSGGLAYSHTIDATSRECTFEVNHPGSHEHSC